MRFSRLSIDYAIAFAFLCSMSFLLPRLLPGDPFLAIYGEEASLNITPEIKAEIMRRFALDQPLYKQFFAFILSLLRLDFGWSFYFNAPVMQVIRDFLPWTLLLAGSSLLLANFFGFVLGIESGWRQGKRFDKRLFHFMLLVGGVPDFFIASLLLLAFAVSWPIFPLGGAVTVYSGLNGWRWLADLLHHLGLPLLSLVLVRTTFAYILTRNSSLREQQTCYVKTARAKGCSDQAIRYRHVGRSVLLPITTSAGIQLSHLFAGVLMVEIIFGYPGIGVLFQKSLSARDYPLVQAIMLLGTMMVLLTNFFIDIIYPAIDPRVKT